MNAYDRYTEKAAEVVRRQTARNCPCGHTVPVHSHLGCHQAACSCKNSGPQMEAQAVLAAVYDDIRADVAEEIAGEIAWGDEAINECGDPYCNAANNAARIARAHATSHTSAAEENQ